jgi:hypothetical protein
MANDQVRYLGYHSGSLSSMEELAEPILTILRSIETKSDVIGKEYLLGFLFSSRGSFPFLKAIDYLHSSGAFQPPITFEIIPHIFSLENLFEIVSDFDSFKYSAYSHILTPIYQEISDKITEKVNVVCCQNGKAIFTDWDEVNTGSNLVERMKIYNNLKIPEKISFHLASFIGASGDNLRTQHIRAFERRRKQSPSNYFFHDIKAKKLISWSDNESFFFDAGLEYPGIAVPPQETIRNILTRRGLTMFYHEFFRNHANQIATAIGNMSDIRYKLLPWPSQGVYSMLSEEEDILQRSYTAFILTMNKMDSEGVIRKGYDPLGRYEIDPDRGQVLRIKSRKKEYQVLLERKHPKTQPDWMPYRQPFVLFYDQEREDSKIINLMMSKYFDKFKNTKL